MLCCADQTSRIYVEYATYAAEERENVFFVDKPKSVWDLGFKGGGSPFRGDMYLGVYLCLSIVRNKMRHRSRVTRMFFPPVFAPSNVD